MAATSSKPRGRPEPCLTWYPCVEEALDSHALKLRVLLLILPCGVISQESFDKVESQRAEFSVPKGDGPWVGQSGKQREGRAAVLVTTRSSTGLSRSERKRDLKSRRQGRRIALKRKRTGHKKAEEPNKFT